MDLIRFQEILEAVPASHWESHLDIGDFAGVECLTTVTRTFSHVARCRVSGTRSRVMVYAKIYRKGLEDPQNWSDEEMFHEQEKMSYWYELFKGNETFGVVRPLGVIPELKMGLTQESQGKVLEELIANKLSLFPGRSAIRELEEALFAVGQWLKYKDEVLTPVPGRYPMEELFEYVDLRLRLLVEEGAHGFDAARRREIMDFFRNNAAAIPPKHLGMVYTHSDFNPGNILIDGKKVTVLDFGRKVEDSALLDMVKLCHQIFLFGCKPAYRQIHLERLQKSLLAGYGTPGLYQETMFRFLFIRNILTHLLASHRRRGKGGIHQRLYDSWVERQEHFRLRGLLAG